MATVFVTSVCLYIFAGLINYNVCYECNEYDNLKTSQVAETSIHESDIYATTVDIVRKYGYPIESHTIITEDGYILTVHRIPGSPKTSSSGYKGPVLVEHGVLGASDNFVLAGPEKGLGFLLADEGYDVWLGNFRGNFYSRKHVTLSPKNSKFWEFSWHEMGVYDLPATIDHILKVTHHPQLFYIGYSMGTTTFFVLTSMRPEYNQKIRLMVAMGPVAYVGQMTSPLFKTIVNYLKLVYLLTQSLGIHEVIPRRRRIQALVAETCREGNPLLELCISALNAAVGAHREDFNRNTAPVLFSHLLAGGSANTIFHFAENVVTDRFQMFDPTVTVGKLTPEYNLSQVTSPVLLMYGESDILAPPRATMRLSRALRKVVQVYRLPDARAVHLDFVFGNDSKRDVYDVITAAFSSFSL